jgi:hypothetical protein
MRLKSHKSTIDAQPSREVWRLRELGCNGGTQVQAVLLYAVAKAINRPVEALPRAELDQLWTAFKAAIDCKSIGLSDLPLPLLSFGERFALAVGVLFDSPELPTGETFLELVDSACESGTEQAGMLALSAILALPRVQAALPVEVLRFYGADPTHEYSDVELDAAVREAVETAQAMVPPRQPIESQKVEGSFPPGR